MRGCLPVICLNKVLQWRSNIVCIKSKMYLICPQNIDAACISELLVVTYT